MNRSGEDNNGGGSSFEAIVAIVENCASFVATLRVKQDSFSLAAILMQLPRPAKPGYSVLLYG